MSVPFSCNLFWGLSLVLRSHDQFEASDWSTLLPYLLSRPTPPLHPAPIFFSFFFLWFVWEINNGKKINLKLYRSYYYPHRSRDSLSPVCGIFTKHTEWRQFLSYNKPGQSPRKMLHRLLPVDCWCGLLMSTVDVECWWRRLMPSTVYFLLSTVYRLHYTKHETL